MQVACAAKSFRISEPRFSINDLPLRTSFGLYIQSERDGESLASLGERRGDAVLDEPACADRQVHPVLVTLFHKSPVPSISCQQESERNVKA